MMIAGYRSSDRGFTLTELLVVIAIIVLLVTILTPSLSQARFSAMRTKCGANLKDVVQACIGYSHESRYSRGELYAALPSTGPDNNNWGNFSKGNPASLWLLMEHEFISGNVLLCPEAKGRLKKKAPQRGDSRFSAETYSYSYLSQVPTTDGYDETPVEKVNASLVILADLNPRCTPGTNDFDSGSADDNSKSHGGDGQNIGSIDQSVKWISKPDETGDNVYAPNSDGDGIQGKRGDLNDSYVCP